MIGRQNKGKHWKSKVKKGLEWNIIRNEKLWQLY